MTHHEELKLLCVWTISVQLCYL